MPIAISSTGERRLDLLDDPAQVALE